MLLKKYLKEQTSLWTYKRYILPPVNLLNYPEKGQKGRYFSLFIKEKKIWQPIYKPIEKKMPLFSDWGRGYKVCCLELTRFVSLFLTLLTLSTYYPEKKGQKGRYFSLFIKEKKVWQPMYLKTNWEKNASFLWLGPGV